MAKRQHYAAEILADERTRISAILESPEGRANMTTALELALRSDLQADQARAILRTMQPESPFLAAMAREGVIGIAPAGAPVEVIAATTAEAKKNTRRAELAAAAAATNAAKGRAPKPAV